MNYKQLQEFRKLVYELLNFAQDATFELMDAVLTTRNVYSLADFSLSPFFRRKWPTSIYEALQDCRPNRNKLMRLYIKQIPAQERPVLAVVDVQLGQGFIHQHCKTVLTLINRVRLLPTNRLVSLKDTVP
jgi:hypothetical protein